MRVTTRRWNPTATARSASAARSPRYGPRSTASFRDRDTAFPWFALRGAQDLPALRSGYVLATRKALTFRDAEVMLGVRVSGRITNARTGRLTVAGRGTYTFRGGPVIR